MMKQLVAERRQALQEVSMRARRVLAGGCCRHVVAQRARARGGDLWPACCTIARRERASVVSVPGVLARSNGCICSLLSASLPPHPHPHRLISSHLISFHLQVWETMRLSEARREVFSALRVEECSEALLEEHDAELVPLVPRPLLLLVFSHAGAGSRALRLKRRVQGRLGFGG